MADVFTQVGVAVMALTAALTSIEVAELTGLTYRQLDHWIRVRAVTPSIRRPAGSGTRTIWSREDVVRLERIARILEDLSALGVHHITRAFIARLWAATGDIEQGTVTIRLGLEG